MATLATRCIGDFRAVFLTEEEPPARDALDFPDALFRADVFFAVLFLAELFFTALFFAEPPRFPDDFRVDVFLAPRFMALLPLLERFEDALRELFFFAAMTDDS